MLFSGIADVCEWFDDEAQKFKVSVKVSNKTWGNLFGYEGSFDVEYVDVPSETAIPEDVRPKREEARE